MTKILLIDDDPDVRTVVGAALAKHGYDVAASSRKEEALAKIAQEEFSLVLLDVLLSGTDGREFCRELKTAEATRHVPVIMFSGHPGAAQNYRSYGADDFMAKPLNTDDLLAKVAQRAGGGKKEKSPLL